MMKVMITTDMDKVKKRLGDLDRKADLIMARAANRAVTTANKTMREEIVKRYYTTPREAGSTLRTVKAIFRSPTAKVVSRGEHINLGKFKVSPNRPVTLKKSGKRSPDVYKATVKRSGGKKTLSGNPKPFVATTKEGHKGVFRRVTGSRRHIIGMAGPSVPQAFQNKEIMQKVNEAGNEMLIKRLDHEISRMLKNG